MASRWNLPRNPHLQVGSRLIQSLQRCEFEKVASFFLIAALLVAAPAAGAATKKPTPKATVKVTVKASVKATAKTTVKATAKPTAKATAKPTAKATAKASKKPVVKKKKKKAKVRVTPSPKAAWPPKGFSVEGEVYAKVPTAKELVSLISANSFLEKQIKQCTKYICGAVQVVAENGCIWWQAVAQVTDAQGNKLGELTKAFAGSTAKEFKTLLMISPEAIEQGGAAKITSVICNHVDRDLSVPGSFYTKA